MNVVFAPPALPKDGVMVVFLPEGGNLSGLAADIDARSEGQIARALKAAKFEAKRDQLLDIIAPAGSKLDRIIVAGLGETKKIVARDIELLGGTIAGALQGAKARTAAIVAELPAEIPIDAAEAAALIASGLRLRVYSFDKYKSKRTAKRSSRMAPNSTWVRSTKRRPASTLSSPGADGVGMRCSRSASTQTS